MPIIALEGMRFFAHHGVYESEQTSGNDFVVDVWLDLGDRLLPETDAIGDAVDYGMIYQVVEAAMSPRANLLETLLGRIGEGLIRKLPEWRSARVRVSKLRPPLPGTCERSYVEETFYR